MIIMSTVDMFGSRLMFRGYGVASRQRGIHAGLTAIDSLVVLDESHLAQALRALLDLAHADAKNVLGKVPPSRVIELSATINNSNQTHFINPATLANDPSPALRKRLGAVREISLVSVPKGSLADEMVKQAKQLAKRPDVRLVAIICNTVKTARQVWKKLKKCWLLTGRIRHYERNQQRGLIISKMLAGKRDRSLPVQFVVATQTIEVGADLDFDGMVSEAAPFDCLIQRFGRKDRLGFLGHSYGVIVRPEEDKDVVYGGLSQATYDYLVGLYPTLVIPNITTITPNPKYFAKVNRIPHLGVSLLDLLAHTHPHYEVNIERLLHGVGKANSDFHIVYRANLSFANKKVGDRYGGKAHKPREVALPQTQELLTMPISVLYSLDDVSDTEFVPGEEDDDGPPKGAILSQWCVRLRDYQIITLEDVVPGDTVFVPCGFGCHDEYGWNPDSTDPVPDVYDHQDSKLRLDSRVLSGFSLKNYRAPDGSVDTQNMLKDVYDRLLPKWEASTDPVEKDRAVHNRRKLKLLVGRRRHAEFIEEGSVYFSVPRPEWGKSKRQLLTDHNANVGAIARRFAEILGLPPELVAILERSGQCHDLGKGHHGFQADRMYHPYAPDPRKILAKSGRRIKLHFIKLRQGWRHELQSVAMMLQNGRDQECSDPELLIHLVAAHHGWWRNSLPAVPDYNFKPFVVGGCESTLPYLEVLKNLDRDAFYRLNRKYGYWGLAFLETLLRLADYEDSRNVNP